MKQVQLGLKENGLQVTLLVFLNLMVGGMVGMERTVVPILGEKVFHLQTRILIFSFIIAFGLVKACSNLVSGALADKYSRKKVLIIGWLLGLPVPFLLAFAPSWGWIIFANVLLGMNQGLTWSMTVNMKIDLVGPRFRGLATGLNEAAGYCAVGLTALATGYIASSYGLRPAPFYLGMVYAVIGILFSILLIKDTKKHAELEALLSPKPIAKDAGNLRPKMFWIFKETSLKNKNLFSLSQAGLINNLKDGMAWGVFPILFFSMGVSLDGVGWIKFIYPFIWGAGQILTGPLSDKWGRKPFIVWGMIIEAIGLMIIGIEPFSAFLSGMAGSVLMGIGTAMVYPVLIAGVGDYTHPTWRASALGVYRFWRDLGYAVGALAAGIAALFLNLLWIVFIIGLITLASGIIVWLRLSNQKSHLISSP